MPRRKLTEPAELPEDDLPELTEYQTQFVHGLLEGLSASDAYRAAYDCSNMKPNSIWCAASKLRSDAKVEQWLNAARKAELGNVKITLDQHIRRLDRLEVIAVETGNVGAAVQAEQIIGKVLGYHIERYEDVTPIDPMQTLAQIAKYSPALAKAIAEQHGMRLIEQVPVPVEA